MKVLVADPLHEQGVQLLKTVAEVDERFGLSEEELVECIGEYEALVVRSGVKVTRRILEAADKLKVVARAGVGVDNIDLNAASERGVIVVNSPAGNTIAATEHTFALLMALARKVPQAHHSLQQGKWERGKFKGVELYKKTLGLVGLGRIGRGVAKRAQGFLMNVMACDPYVDEEYAAEAGVKLVETVEELFAEADFVSLHVPATEKTRGMVNRELLAKAKPGLRLVNCARGPLVDLDALYEALKSGKLAGAALDVFPSEPPDFSHPIFKLEQVVVTPHLGASTEEAQCNVAVDVCQQVVDVLKGLPATSAVNLPAVAPEVLAFAKPYLLVAEKMGRLSTALLSGRIKQVEVACTDELFDKVGTIVARSFLKGLLEPILSTSVNYVNAPLIAKARGIEVVEKKTGEAVNYPNEIRTTVFDETGEETEVLGTVFGANDARIVELNHLRVDVVPEGYKLILPHEDQPGMIGQVGTLLGQHDINIAGMQVGRNTPRGNAVMVLSVDDPVPQEVMQRILEVPGIKGCVLVEL